MQLRPDASLLAVEAEKKQIFFRGGLESRLQIEQRRGSVVGAGQQHRRAAAGYQGLSIQSARRVGVGVGDQMERPSSGFIEKFLPGPAFLLYS